MTQQTAKFLAIIFSLTTILSGCGNSGSGSNNTPLPTATLTASPPSIVQGQSSTLTIASTNAETGTINNGVGQAGINDKLVVTPKTTTTYTLMVSGPGGTATAQATVTVSPINSFDGIAEGSGPETSTTNDVDPNGSVGTKQFMEYVNTEFQAYSKTSPYTPVWSEPQQIGTVFKSPLNQPDIVNCDGRILSGSSLPSGIHVDAVIDFDRMAQRWVVMGKADFSNAFYLCLAVSNTDDLTSSKLGWYAYILGPMEFVGTNLDGHYYFPDWPKLGIWPDGYYVAMDLQDVDSGYAEVGMAACVFDRNDILAQTSASPPNVLAPACTALSPATSPPVTLDSSSKTYLSHSLIPADFDGTTAPPTARPEYMVSIQNPSVVTGALTSDAINLWEATTNWAATPPTLTMTRTQPSVTTFTPGCYLSNPDNPNPAATICVNEPSQGNQGEQVDSVGDRLMPRFAYRNFGSYESFLVSHTVQTGPGASGTNSSADQTGIRWYELRDSGTGTPAIHQQGTINPDNELFRFLPSIAEDKNGNAAVGYSFSNSFTDPGINFSYWDLGTSDATPVELTIMNGAGEELTTAPVPGEGDWGSYSSMTVDPTDDCTFWYVNEYWPSNSSWTTRIAYFSLPGCQ